MTSGRRTIYAQIAIGFTLFSGVIFLVKNLPHQSSVPQVPAVIVDDVSTLTRTNSLTSHVKVGSSSSDLVSSTVLQQTVRTTPKE